LTNKSAGAAQDIPPASFERVYVVQACPSKEACNRSDAVDDLRRCQRVPKRVQGSSGSKEGINGIAIAQKMMKRSPLRAKDVSLNRRVSTFPPSDARGNPARRIVDA